MLIAMVRTLAASGALLAAAECNAQERVDLRGSAYIAGKTIVDPPPNETKNTHAYLQLSGPAALQLYRNMRVKEEPNLCETRKKMKRAGPLMCSLAPDGRSATCDFSINLQAGRLESGQAC